MISYLIKINPNDVDGFCFSTMAVGYQIFLTIKVKLMY